MRRLRAQVDARRRAILACTGGADVAVALSWDASGRVAATVRDAGDDAAACVVRALSTLRASRGIAGALVRRVTR